MKYWLMKAEPNSRLEKGTDVKFSVDDFELVKTTAWEGVRNHEAKKLMQSMKIGDQVLFYHSNCKNPGVAGFAEVSKEAYPDHTAWDAEHPYYDPKSDKENPKWFMVDLDFKSRAAHLVPLVLFKRIAGSSTDEPPSDVEYIGTEGVHAVKDMALIKRGRLSVQPVEEDAWKAVQLLAEKGGWKEEIEISSGNKQHGGKLRRGTKKNQEKGDESDSVVLCPPEEKKSTTKPTRGRRKPASEPVEDGNRNEPNNQDEDHHHQKKAAPNPNAKQTKRKAVEITDVDIEQEESTKSSAPRRSTRSRR